MSTEMEKTVVLVVWILGLLIWSLEYRSAILDDFLLRHRKMSFFWLIAQWVKPNESELFYLKLSKSFFFLALLIYTAGIVANFIIFPLLFGRPW